MSKKKMISLVGFGALLAPMFIFAQNTTMGLGGIIATIGTLLNDIVPVLIALAVVYFIYGVISFVLAKEEEAKTLGRDKIIYGLIGIVVIVGMWGLVSILANTFGIKANGTSNGVGGPCVPIPGTPNYPNC